MSRTPKRNIMIFRTFSVVAAMTLALPVIANPVQDGYRGAAKQETAAFTDFSATRGEAFYKAKSGDVSCANCHGDSPKAHGKHATTGKDILAMAPVTNAERFTDAAKVEKWFKRNCNDVLKRACTANEKGDFIAYLLSVK
jgi:mono/diheme cytochrome c family protein